MGFPRPAFPKNRGEMPRKPIDMRKIREALRLHHEMGAKEREIAAACNIAPSTVHEYLRRAGLAGISWPLPQDCSDKRLEELLFARHEQTGPRQAPDWKAVQRELTKKNMTLTVVWEDYKKENPYGYAQPILPSVS